MGEGGGERRRGAVLVLCVLLVLALALLAHGALLMAREELAVSRAGGEVLRARAAAEAGVADVVRGDGVVPADTVTRGGSQRLAVGTLQGARYHVDARRLSREVWLLEGRGAVRPDAWVARAAWPAWSMDPGARIAAFRGVVEVGDGAPVFGQARVTPGDPSVTDPIPEATACAVWRQLRDSLSALPELPSLAVSDTERTAGAPPPREPALVLLDVEDLLGAATRDPVGTGTPGPSATASLAAFGAGGSESESTCQEGAWSWGDPDHPLGRCHGVFPLIGAGGPLTVAGGVGQGVLVVAGDLKLERGASFYGLVLVEGTLTLESGARLVGLARAVGGLSVDGDSEVTGSRCWAFAALDAALDLLARPRLLPAGRVGPF